MENTDQNNQKVERDKQSPERKPGQGNEHGGVSRRLGTDPKSRGEKEMGNLQDGEGMGEERREREGSQGGSRGQGGEKTQTD